jgi:hypothetical protein
LNTTKRSLLIIGTLASLVPLAGLNAQAATTTETRLIAEIGAPTPMDLVFDKVVAGRVAADKLSSSDARLLREQLQLQFQSLSTGQQQKVVAATRNISNEEGVARALAVLNSAVQADAKDALAAYTAATAKSALQQGKQPKFGATDNNLVFVATTGPCRVADTRFSSQIPPVTGVQIYGYSNIAGYDWTNQGGSGLAGSGNCTGTVYVGTAPVDVVATVTVVNTASVGSLQAWNGGTTLTVGGVLAWNPGDRLSNTTVIPMNRGIPAYPGSGFKRDFAVYNNSGTGIDIIVDVVGYFVHNNATPLECTSVAGALTVIAPGTSQFLNAPSCPAGYTAMSSQPDTGVYGLVVGTIFTSGCRINNVTSGALSGACNAQCCRLPGL